MQMSLRISNLAALMSALHAYSAFEYLNAVFKNVETQELTKRAVKTYTHTTANYVQKYAL